jgi:hypothetical protein
VFIQWEVGREAESANNMKIDVSTKLTIKVKIPSNLEYCSGVHKSLLTLVWSKKVII